MDTQPERFAKFCQELGEVVIAIAVLMVLVWAIKPDRGSQDTATTVTKWIIRAPLVLLFGGAILYFWGLMIWHGIKTYVVNPVGRMFGYIMHD